MMSSSDGMSSASRQLRGPSKPVSDPGNGPWIAAGIALAVVLGVGGTLFWYFTRTPNTGVVATSVAPQSSAAPQSPAAPPTKEQLAQKAEEARLAAERKAAEEREAEARKQEEARLAEAKRLQEEQEAAAKKAAEEQKAAAEKLAAEEARKVEEARLAEENKARLEKQIAETEHFEVYSAAATPVPAKLPLPPGFVVDKVTLLTPVTSKPKNYYQFEFRPDAQPGAWDLVAGHVGSAVIGRLSYDQAANELTYTQDPKWNSQSAGKLVRNCAIEITAKDPTTKPMRILLRNVRSRKPFQLSDALKHPQKVVESGLLKDYLPHALYVLGRVTVSDPKFSTAGAPGTPEEAIVSVGDIESDSDKGRIYFKLVVSDIKSGSPHEKPWAISIECLGVKPEGLSEARWKPAGNGTSPEYLPINEQKLKDWTTRISAAIANVDRDIKATSPQALDILSKLKTDKAALVEELALVGAMRQNWNRAQNIQVGYAICLGYVDDQAQPFKIPLVQAKLSPPQSSATPEPGSMDEGAALGSDAAVAPSP